MRATEAHKRLTLAGWVRVRQTSNRHEVWRMPDGRLRTLGLNYRRVDQNEVAMTRQAMRAANRRTEPMRVDLPETSTSAAALSAPIAAAARRKSPPQIQVYRTPEGTVQGFAELILGETEAAHLGGVNASVSLTPEGDGVWSVTRGGAITIRQKDSGYQYRVKSKLLVRAVPPTGRTALPAEWREDGFTLFTGSVVAVDPRSRSESRETAEPAREVAPEVEQPTVAADPILTPSKAEVVKQRASLARFGTSFAARPAQPPKRASSLEDLRAALQMLRDVVGELGVTLYGANGLSIPLDDIEVRVRL